MRWLLLSLLPLYSISQVTAVVDQWKADSSLKNASIGICIREAVSGQVLYELNSSLSLVPASTLKIATTGAAIALLGKNYRFETKIYHTGTFDKEKGIINGDLIIKGFGDPTLQSDNYSKESITDKWSLILKEKGIKEIRGSVIGDATYFEKTIPDNWVWGDIGNYFAAVPCALSYMDNKFRIIYSTEGTGSVAKVIGIEPTYLSNTITINSSVTARGSEDEAFVYGDPSSWIKKIHGTIPPNKKRFEVKAVLPDPALLCAEKMYSSLVACGINCRGAAVSRYGEPDSTRSHILHLNFSPTLDRIIYYTNMQSHNLYCESILRALGKGNMSAGIGVVRNYWKSKGLDEKELYMTDGSGLSRANSITASMQSEILCRIYNDSLNYKIINASLPVAGVHGSMAAIGKGTVIENNLRAKTGYINRVRTYCGYVTSKTGKDLAFSIILNNYNCNAKEARLKIEQLMIRLAEL
jgi:serine-type D-Ala-D-Ala carboxypeptidase/endopeptidase (penicillin-binding protein 4)